MKLFTYCTTAPAGYSPNVQLDGPEYSHWEIPAEKIHDAVNAVKKAGYREVKWFRRTSDGIVWSDGEKSHQEFWEETA